MKIITLFNEKGGVGKTTLSTHIAAGLAIRGWRVLLVDTDSQGNATTAFGLGKEPGLYRLLIQDAEFDDVLRRVDQDVLYPEPVSGQLWVLPSNIETMGIMTVRPNPFLLRERLSELEGHFDYVIIDTSPTPSVIHGSIYIATDGILFPTECNRFSLEGLAESILRKEDGDAYRATENVRASKVMGIVPTMYRSGVDAHDIGIRQLRERFHRLVWPSVPLRTVWEKAAWSGWTVWRFEPDSEAALHAWSLVDRVLQSEPEGV